MLSENTTEVDVVLIVLFSLGATTSMISWFFIGIVYSVGERLSLPPGSLIASQAFSYLVNTFILSSYLLISLVSSLSTDSYVDPQICELALVLIIYSRSLSLSYDLGVSIELIYKVQRPHSKEYLIPLPFYHVTCQIVAVLFALEKHFEAHVEWLTGEGCVFDQSALSM